MEFEGKKLVTECFGSWPSFLDAEIKKFVLSTPSVVGDLASAKVQIHCWEMTSELDESGYYA